jgi:hypothetical protein
VTDRTSPEHDDMTWRLVWIGVKLFLLVLLLDATETIVLYQNY